MSEFVLCVCVCVCICVHTHTQEIGLELELGLGLMERGGGSLMFIKNPQLKTHTHTHTRNESCNLSFIWGNLKTATQKTAPQIALRNCSKEVVGKDSIYEISVKREYIQSSTYFSKRLLLVL